MEKLKARKKASLQAKLIRLFSVTSIIPILLLSLFFYYNISDIIRKNIEELTIKNLEQTANTLKLKLKSYEDLLSMYTDDNIVALVDKINEEDLVVGQSAQKVDQRLILYHTISAPFPL